LSGVEEYILGWLLLRPELLASLDAEMIGQQTPPLGQRISPAPKVVRSWPNSRTRLRLMKV